MVNVALHLPLLYAAARFWRFPIPFVWVLFACVFLATMAIAHLVVLGSALWRERELVAAFCSYAPTMLFQSAQIVFYPCFSLLFDHVGERWRVVLTVLFPLVKIALKLTLQRLARHLDDHGAETAVCGVEICASLYQSMILQTSPSPVAMAYIIGLDALQSVAMIKWFLDKHARTEVSTLSGKLLIDAARFLVDRHDVASQTESNLLATTSTRSATSPTSHVLTLRGRRVSVTRHEHMLIVQHALETAFLAEEVLLVEYIEVIVPVIYSLFLALAARLETSQYNPRLRPFYEHDERFLVNALVSIWLYAALQAASLAVRHVVLKRRYGISGMQQLAFVLERHRPAILGKLVVWVPFILHFTLVQYGVDFTFRFDFA